MLKNQNSQTLIKMKNNINIAIVGLGQVVIYLYNELNIKKKDIEKKFNKYKKYYNRFEIWLFRCWKKCSQKI